jgi:hypothetical protein
MRETTTGRGGSITHQSQRTTSIRPAPAPAVSGRHPDSHASRVETEASPPWESTSGSFRGGRPHLLRTLSCTRLPAKAGAAESFIEFCTAAQLPIHHVVRIAQCGQAQDAQGAFAAVRTRPPQQPQGSLAARTLASLPHAPPHPRHARVLHACAVRSIARSASVRSRARRLARAGGGGGGGGGGAAWRYALRGDGVAACGTMQRM